MSVVTVRHVILRLGEGDRQVTIINGGISLTAPTITMTASTKPKARKGPTKRKEWWNK